AATLVFCDPPYADVAAATSMLASVAKNHAIGAGATVVLEHATRDAPETAAPTATRRSVCTRSRKCILARLHELYAAVAIGSSAAFGRQRHVHRRGHTSLARYRRHHRLEAEPKADAHASAGRVGRPERVFIVADQHL